MTTLLNINSYTIKFGEYPVELIKFASESSLKLPGINTLRGQALSLLSQPEIRGQKHISRHEATEFFKNIGLSTPDSIQPFNKTFGLKRKVIGIGLYCLEYPFILDKVDIDKRKGALIGGDRDSVINEIKKWHSDNIIDAPNKDWQIGHLDPTISDASEKNLAYQPPIQGKYRNRFKFDSKFHKMWPTAEVELIPKIDKYYTEKEQRLIYESLKKKFEK